MHPIGIKFIGEKDEDDDNDNKGIDKLFHKIKRIQDSEFWIQLNPES